MSLPNFLIVGAAKSGTSAMTKFLAQHPEVHIPFKEPNYFSGWNSRVVFKVNERLKPRSPWYVQCATIEEYETLFANSGDAIARGEASVSYLVDEKAAAKIRAEFPDMKIIILLRQPVDRAFSHFHHNLRLGVEPVRDFQRVIELEAERLAGGWIPFMCPIHVSHYAVQLPHYLDAFPREQIRIYLYEDFNRTPGAVWNDLTSFLGISTEFTPNFHERHNENVAISPVWSQMRKIAPLIKGVVPQPAWVRLREGLKKSLSKRKILAPRLRRELTHEHFLADIRCVEDLLGRDLSHWLN